MSRDFDAIIAARRSTRRFLPDQPPREALEHALRLARMAPSGANLQPGRVIALTGTPLETLRQALLAAYEAEAAGPQEYDYFPRPMPPELKARQRAAGYALYQALGIDKRDIPGRKRQFARNMRFFDAPVGLVVTIDRRMGKGCFMDLGMFLQTLLLALENAGLASCGIGAIAPFHQQVRKALALPAGEIVVCGVALGYPDPNAPENAFRTDREDLGVYADFHGFGDEESGAKP